MRAGRAEMAKVGLSFDARVMLSGEFLIALRSPQKSAHCGPSPGPFPEECDSGMGLLQMSMEVARHQTRVTGRAAKRTTAPPEAAPVDAAPMDAAPAEAHARRLAQLVNASRSWSAGSGRFWRCARISVGGGQGFDAHDCLALVAVVASAGRERRLWAPANPRLGQDPPAPLARRATRPERLPQAPPAPLARSASRPKRWPRAACTAPP